MCEYVTVWMDDLPDLKRGEEIVRCRDCAYHEHWEYNNSKPDRDICLVYYCIDVSLDDFCSSGERKQ